MISHVDSVAFQGIEVLPVDVQCQLGGGLPAFTLVGLPDKAVAESRERVRAALGSLAPASLLALINHFKGSQVLGQPVPALAETPAGTIC